jgi:hypothetical protein
VFFDVDIPLQSLAFPPSLQAPPLLLPPAPEPLFQFVPLSDPEPKLVAFPEPLPELEPDLPPLLPDC